MRSPWCVRGAVRAALAGSLVGCADRDRFYDEPVPDLDRLAPGDVIRLDRIGRTSRTTLALKAGGSPRGAEVYRVLYRTTGLDGAPDVASARVALPDDLPPGEPAPIVAHLHGTVGLADRCAPSRSGGFGFESSTNPNAARMVARGAVVVAPDYLGLGPPGPHPYVAAEPTAHSVLDAIRAAERLRDPERSVRTTEAPAVLLEGHSQGGHAVLAALRYAEDYAPELLITAAVAISPPGAPQDLLPALADADRFGGFVALATLGWTRAWPELGDETDWIADERLLDKAEQRCLLGLSGWMDDPASDLLAPDVARAYRQGDFASVGLDGVVLAEDLGELRTPARLLVVHGTEDDLLPIALTRRLVDRMVEAGTDATWLPVEGGDHLMLPHRARDEVTAFLDEALQE